VTYYPTPGDTHVPFSKLSRSLKLPQTATLALRAPEQYVSHTIKLSFFDIKNTPTPPFPPPPQNPNIYIYIYNRHCCPTFVVGAGIKDTISVRARVPVVPFLRRARRYPDTPQSNDGNRLHHECALPPRERLWLARSANSPVWFCPRWKRRCRICAQMVAAPSRAAAAAAAAQHDVGAAARLSCDNRWSAAIISYSVSRLPNANPRVSPTTAGRAIRSWGRPSGFQKGLFESRRCQNERSGHASLKG
jgi:hypothetical protein